MNHAGALSIEHGFRNGSVDRAEKTVAENKFDAGGNQIAVLTEYVTMFVLDKALYDVVLLVGAASAMPASAANRAAVIEHDLRSEMGLYELSSLDLYRTVEQVHSHGVLKGAKSQESANALRRPPSHPSHKIQRK